MKCSIVGNVVTFNLNQYWSEVDSGNLIIDLYDVINPTGIIDSGGNFAINALSGTDVIIDSNLVFTSIGYAPFYA